MKPYKSPYIRYMEWVNSGPHRCRCGRFTRKPYWPELEVLCKRCEENYEPPEPDYNAVTPREQYVAAHKIKESLR